MSSTIIPRALVTRWSDDIGENRAAHQSELSRIASQQKRLIKFIAGNPSLHPFTVPFAREFALVALRVFDLAGGRMKVANSRHLAAAQERLRPVAVTLLPYDAGFADRVRAIEWRAQPHLLDEAVEALFFPGPSGVARDELVKVFLAVWLVAEVANANWTPPPHPVGIPSTGVLEGAK